MALYRLNQSEIEEIPWATFAELGIRERYDLQQLLRRNISAIAPDCLVLTEEFGDFEDSRRRIDLLALDRAANLVVIELKRDEEGGHMELQALRYAAMVSTMTFQDAVDTIPAHCIRMVKNSTRSRVFWISSDLVPTKIPSRRTSASCLRARTSPRNSPLRSCGLTKETWTFAACASVHID
ncbi:MAG: hypothetical protein M3R67_07960 [Acidobacteriota bacterium]|nr:hypothetical protein [Acidobacteriota bacterium]